MHVSLEIVRVVHVDDDIQNSALDVFYETDGRKSRYTKEVGIEKKMLEILGEVNRYESAEMQDMTQMSSRRTSGRVRNVVNGRKVDRTSCRMRNS